MLLWSRLRAEVAAYPRAFWVLWLGTLVNRLGLVVVPFLTLYLTTERGLRPSWAAALLSGYGLGAFLSSFAGGVLADRWGRRPVLLMGLMGGAALVALVPFVTALPALAVLVIALGFVTESYRPAVSAAIVDLVAEEQRTRAFALFYWVINVGTAIAPVLGGALVLWSYDLLFALDAVTMLVYGFVVAALIPETRPSRNAEAGADASGAEGPPTARALDALRDPALLGLSACTLLLAALMFQSLSVLPLVMASQGLPETAYGFVAATNGLVIVLLSLPIARFVEGRRPGAVLVSAALLFAAGFALHIPAALLGGHAAATAVWTLGEIALVTVAPVMVARLSPDALRGAYQGVYGAAWGLAFLVAPLAGGVVFEELGRQALWMGCVGIGLVAALGFASLAPQMREPASGMA
ncbi:MAG: MFS transporter [Bacteroidota bacterium]